MSQEENELPPPSKSTSSIPLSTKTSAVPLKKETVRITLRANAPGADAPPATVPLAPRPAPSVGSPPAPTVPLSPPPRPTIGGAPPAPTAPTAPGAPPRPAPPVAPVGSKTIPLGATPPRPASPALARPAGAPAAPVGGGTQPLPKATVKLPSAAPTAAISSAPIRTASMADDDEDVDDGPLNIMAWVALVASLATLFFAFASVDSWPLSNGVADTTTKREDWQKDNIPASFKLPMDYSPFDRKVGETVKSDYEDKAPKIPARPTVD
jgi:hypothetical protein